MTKLTVRDLDLKGNRVFIRVDFNVPIKNGKVQDDLRILESLPTIQYALHRGAVVILASHLGRPKGKRDPEYSLAPVAARLSELAGRKVKFVPDCVGPDVENAVAAARAGDLLLIGGAMMFTFLKSQGGRVGRSLCEDDKLALAGDLLSRGCHIVLPLDAVASRSIEDEKSAHVVPAGAIADGEMGLDIGPQT